MVIARAQRIDDILETRKPSLKGIELALAAATSLSAAVVQLDSHRTELVGVVTDVAARTRLQSLDLKEPMLRLAQEVATLEKLRVRFSRVTLNIGVIGRARQGKSQLLKSLSGLSDSEIPTGSGSHCTGVRSTIQHSSDISPHAEVTFHTDTSFMAEMIAPYYRDLGLGATPRGIHEFRRNPIPEIPQRYAGSASAMTKYGYLQNYLDQLPHYEELLGRPVQRIPIEEVREYVAQDNEAGQRIYFSYLAVRHVKVISKFPYEDVGRLALVDMPGLGDTGIGDAERMVQVLGEDVDAVILVKLPATTGAIWAQEDIDLYDLAKRSLLELPIEAWSFLALNHLTSSDGKVDNASQCDLLAREAPSKNLSVVNTYVANCREPQDARENILDPTLAYLVERMAELDRQYVSTCQGRLDSICADVASVASIAGTALGRGSLVEGEFRRFNELFKAIWRDLTNGLERLMTDLREWSNQPNRRLYSQVEACFDACRGDSGIPSISDIEISAQQNGSYNTAFNQALHSVRTNLVGHFLVLEDTLRLSLEDVREAVSNVFRTDARLGDLVQAADGDYLATLANQIPKEYPLLRGAFQTLTSVELTYRGFLQYRMRQHLMNLHPDGATKDGQIRVTPNAEGVHQALEVLHSRVVYRLEEAFEGWLSEPNLVACAIVEEFVDRVLRSDEAYDEWQNFYLENRASVWSDEFNEIGERSRHRVEWEASVSRVQELSNPLAFRISQWHRS